MLTKHPAGKGQSKRNSFTEGESQRNQMIGHNAIPAERFVVSLWADYETIRLMACKPIKSGAERTVRFNGIKFAYLLVWHGLRCSPLGACSLSISLARWWWAHRVAIRRFKCCSRKAAFWERQFRLWIPTCTIKSFALESLDPDVKLNCVRPQSCGIEIASFLARKLEIDHF